MSSPNSFCPYIGLQPYTEDYREYFFGRKRDERIIVSNLYAAPLTVLYGASGVGKSSVLLAGVVPHLRTRPRTAVVVFREWQAPSFLHALKSECLKAVGVVRKKPLDLDITLPFDEFLFQATQAFGGSMLILFDQFEEYFLYHPESEADNVFDAEFARAVNREEVDASFLLVLREDGLSKLDRFLVRIPHLLGNLLRLQHLDETAAEEAIRKPLEVYNTSPSAPDAPMTIEDDLVPAILSQVRTGQVQLSKLSGVGQTQIDDKTVQIETPFLQLVLTRLWEEEVKAHSHALRLHTFERLGGAQEIVRKHLDDVMYRLGQTEQEVCARFFDRLVTPTGNKITYAVEDLRQWAGNLAAYVQSVLEKLSNNRILRGVAALPGQPDALRYEIFHDVLAPAILDWKARFEQGQELKEAERQRAAEAERQQKELAQAHAFAAERSKIVTRLQWTLYALGVVFLVLLVMGWLMIRSKESQKSAELESKRADAEALALHAKNYLASDPELGVLVAFHAALLTYPETKTVPSEVVEALYRAEQTPRTKYTLSHPDIVNSITFGPDGERLATASADKTARVWEVGSEQAVQTFSGHDGAVFGVAFSLDGKRLATASEDKTAKVWDVDTGREVRTFPGHDGAVFGVAFSLDGKRLATASEDKTAKVWDVDTGREVRTFSGHDGAVFGVAFSRDGERLATASADKRVKVWEVASGQAQQTLIGHTGQVSSVAFSPDGKRLATAGFDKTVRVWEVASGQAQQTLIDHPDPVIWIAFSPHGERLATASTDGTVKVWDTESGQEIVSLSGLASDVSGIALDWGRKRLAMASKNQPVKVWDVELGHSSPIVGAAFSQDGKRLIKVSKDQIVKVDVDSRQEVPVFSGQASDISGMALSGDGKRLATARADKTVQVWDIDSRQEVPVFSSQASDISGMALSGDGKRLATARADKTVQVWDVDSGQQIQPLSGLANSTINIVLSGDGKRLATARADKTVQVWDVDSGREVWPFAGHTDEVVSIAFSSDGMRLATASADKTVKVWDINSGQEVRTFSGYVGPVVGIAFSLDGTHLVAVGLAKMVDFVLDTEKLISMVGAHLTRSLTLKECREILRHNCPMKP